MGLKSNEGLLFFAFPGVTSPNLFKQLYRSRMNSVELTEEERNGVLEEAVRAFELNIQVRSSDGEAEQEIWKQKHLSEDSFTKQVNPSSSWWMFLSLFLQVFDDLQKMVCIGESQLQSPATHSKVKTLQVPGMIINTSPLLRMVLGLFVALATVSMGIYAF